MSFAKAYLYVLILTLVASPALATTLGLPRPDTLASPLNVLVLLALLPFRSLPLSVAVILFSFLIAFGFAVITILPPPSLDVIPDAMLVPVPALLLLLLVHVLGDARDPEHEARRVLGLSALLIALPVLLEVIAGVQFVRISAVNGELEGGIYRGTFFNPNDLATVATMFAVAICYFYIMRPCPPRERLFGVLMLGLLCFSVVVAGSRTATLILVLALGFCGFMASSGPGKILILIASGVALVALSDLAWLEDLLLYLETIPAFQRSAERLHLAIFAFADDNSISYRAEVYSHFLDNFEFLVLGYGPRNFGEFFTGLSYSLAATNPHSFPIEAYLAFGVFGALAYVVVLAMIAGVFWLSRNNWQDRTFAILALAVFIGLTFVPSSILRIAVLWMPLMLIVATHATQSTADRPNRAPRHTLDNPGKG